MKKFTSGLTEENYKICGKDKGSPLAISRVITDKVFANEELHTHDTYEFYMFVKGKAEMEINGKIIQVAAGDVILVEEGEKHRVTKVIEEIDYICIKDGLAKRFVD